MPDCPTRDELHPARHHGRVVVKKGRGMAEADLDAVIRDIAKKQNKVLMDAAKKRRDLYIARAAKASDKGVRDGLKLAGQNTMLFAAAAAKRMQVSAINAADSYARAMKRAAEEEAARRQAADKKDAGKKTAKKAVKKAVKKKG
jgi:hypothetical protein